MQFIDGQLVLSPTDLTRHQECSHLTALDLAVAERRLPAPPEGTGDELELIFERGLAHEHSYLASLEAEGRTIARIATEFTGDGRRRAEAATVEAMQAGVDVVYQATFFDGVWGGQADFLLKVPGESNFGAWAYDIADTKLARRMKVAALLQMATYAERLTELQGFRPKQISVVTGDGVVRPWRLVDVAAYARRARNRMETFVDGPGPTEPVPIAHCTRCRWAARCDAEWRSNDDLSLVAFMRRDHRAQLRAAGIITLEQLAAASPAQLSASGIGKVARARLHEQAREQLEERRTGTPSRTLLPPSEGMGLLRLPPRSHGDLYLDFEGDPYFEDGESLEYLAGLGDREGRFTALWAHTRDEEKRMVADLVDRLIEVWRDDPDMHVYHYAPYETAALKRLTGRYGVREAELDQLLRAERFVDLYPVVRQSMRISKESYSIKKVEAFYGRHHDGAVADAMSSVAPTSSGSSSRTPRSWPGSRPTTATTSTRPASCMPGSSSSAADSRRSTDRSRGPHRRRTPRRRRGRPRKRPSWRSSSVCRQPVTTCSATSSSGTGVRPDPRGGRSSASRSWKRTSSSRTPPPSGGSPRRCRSASTSAASCTSTASRRRTRSCASVRARSTSTTTAPRARSSSSTPSSGASC